MVEAGGILRTEKNMDKDLSPYATDSVDFIRSRIIEDNENGRYESRVQTRFPPEPNGYLHIGHAKAFCLNFGVAEEFGGTCNLRFDDTNPAREDPEYVEGIKNDIRWLGFDWGEELYASDYFEQMYEYAVQLIRKGRAYVCDLSAEEVREYRGTLTEPGKNSPNRDRSVDENLDLFRRMRAGEFPDGSRSLRAKIDMASPNINMRDPVLYRIMRATHDRTGDTWCIYPTYDFAHGYSDSIEGVTHSLCDIGFENHRPLYDWLLDELDLFHPQQLEFARFAMTYTVTSKRLLRRLVEEGHVQGWDDPRMPTLLAMRRRGYSPEAIRDLMLRVGVAKVISTIDFALFEHHQREVLNKQCARVMVVLDPLKLIIDNYPEGQAEELEAENNPEDESAGSRGVPFSRELYIEREDFMEDPPKKFFRLSPGKEIRLKHAYYVKCVDVVKDATSGEITEIHCTYDPASRGGWTDDGRKVRGTSHWVSAPHALSIEVRIYDQLFTTENPLDAEEGKDFTDYVNADSLRVLTGCKAEPSLAGAGAGTRYQFLRKGYFCADPDTTPDRGVFNKTIGLVDTWAKMQKQK